MQWPSFQLLWSSRLDAELFRIHRDSRISHRNRYVCGCADRVLDSCRSVMVYSSSQFQTCAVNNILGSGAG